MNYANGLTHEDYKKSGESGEYRPDLDRFFLPGMAQPPRPQPAAIQNSDVSVEVLQESSANTDKPRFVAPNTDVEGGKKKAAENALKVKGDN